MDHGLGHVYALLIVSDQAAPSREPSEGAFNDPTTRQHLEARLLVDPANDLDNELVEGGLVHELRTVVCAVGEQMFEPRPAFAHRVQDHLGTGAIGYVGGGEVDHQQPSVGVHRDMAFAAHGLLVRVEPTLRAGSRSLDRLTVEHAAGRAGLATLALAIHHQRDVVDRLEQHQPDETPKPPIDSLPWREVLRQHALAAPGARHISDRVQDLPRVHARLATAPRRPWMQRRNPLPFRVSEIGRVTLRLPLDLGHPASGLSRPHPNRESRIAPKGNPLSQTVS